MVRGEHSPMSHHHLVTRDHRRLDKAEIGTAVTEARAKGLLTTADRWQLAPVELYHACLRLDPQLRAKIR
jgi:hypothetical protein